MLTGRCISSDGNSTGTNAETIGSSLDRLDSTAFCWSRNMTSNHQRLNGEMGKKVEKGASARIPDWSKTGISRCVEEVPHLTAEYMQMRRREDHSVSANSMGDRETTGRVDVVVEIGRASCRERV